MGVRGQVTIPKEIRDQFAIGAETEAEFEVRGGTITLRKIRPELNLAKWKGYCGKSFGKMGYSSVDEFIEDVRDR